MFWQAAQAGSTTCNAAFVCCCCCCSRAGSGYLSAAMAKMVAPDGFVLGVDKVS